MTTPPLSQSGLRINLSEDDIDLLVSIYHARQQQYFALGRGQKEKFWTDVREELFRQTGKDFKNCNQKMTALAKQRTEIVRRHALNGTIDKLTQREGKLSEWNAGLDLEDLRKTNAAKAKTNEETERQRQLQIQPKPHRGLASVQVTSGSSPRQKSSKMTRTTKTTFRRQ